MEDINSTNDLIYAAEATVTTKRIHVETKIGVPNKGMKCDLSRAEVLF